MVPITTGRRKPQTIVKTYVFENMRAVEARSPFRGRASANHDGTLNCSSWFSISLSDTVGVCELPGSFLGLPGGSLREGNELREERDGTKEEAHASDPQGVGGLSPRRATVPRRVSRILISKGCLRVL